MAERDHLSNASHSRQVAGCVGSCLENAESVFNSAKEAVRAAGIDSSPIDKRFGFLEHACGENEHQKAEMMLEHALALYELVYGQEHAHIAQMLIDLGAMYRSHGNADYADYLRNWGNDMLDAHREEPTHEFFHLFGMSEEPGLNA